MASWWRGGGVLVWGGARPLGKRGQRRQLDSPCGERRYARTRTKLSEIRAIRSNSGGDEWRCP
eukprot:1186927-Lingulodinium_polyedra.AAC.1